MSFTVLDSLLMQVGADGEEINNQDAWNDRPVELCRVMLFSTLKCKRVLAC